MKRLFIGLVLCLLLMPSISFGADAKASADATVVPASGDLILGLQGGTANKNFAYTSFQPALSLLKGTYTNTYLCTYTTAGTLLDCNTNPASFQTPTGTPAGFVIAAQATGDLLYASTAAAWSRLGAGTNGSILRQGATIPAWSTETWAVPGAVGGILYSDGTNWVRLAAGTDGYVLKAKGAAAPEWSNTMNFSVINLPSTDADPGTTAGQIRHDSTDTGSNSGGTVKWYDGAQVRSFIDTGTDYTIITKTEYLPIRYAEDGTTPPSAVAEVSTTTEVARSFTEGDDVVFWWVVPADYVGGIKYRVHYALSANANADETVIYSMAGSIVGNSGALAGAAGTALTIADELGTDDDQYQYMVTDYSAESNADWNLVAGGLARLQFSNAAAGDLATGEPLVIGIEIKYKAKILGFGSY